MAKVDIAKLAEQLTPAQVRQLARIAESNMKLARLKARRKKMAAELERVETAIAKITGAASPNKTPKPDKPTKPAKRATTGEPRRQRSRQARTIATDAWLTEFLADGWRPASEVYAAGKEAGFSEKQMQNARPRTGVQVRFFGYPALSHWRLAATPERSDSIPIPDSRRKGAGPDRKGYMSPTATWLATFLAGGERPVSEVYAAGKAVGFTKPRLFRARHRIGAHFRFHGISPQSYWRLAGTVVPDNSIPEVPASIPASPDRTQNYRSPSATWLAAFLADGERSASEAYAAGKEAGFSDRHLQTTRRRMGVQVRYHGDPPKCYWRLAEPAPIPDAGSQDGKPSAPARNRNTNPTPAAKWLAAFLADGERPVSEAYAAGKAAGFTEYQLQRGRHRLGAKTRKCGFPATVYWRLAGDATPPSDVEAWLTAFLADVECPASEAYAAGKEAGFSRKQLKLTCRRLGVQFRLRGYPAKTHWRLADATPPEGQAAEAPQVRNHQQPTPAVTWLKAFLADGERPVAEAFAAGREAGFSQDQLQYAHHRLGAHSRLRGHQQNTRWQLAGDTPPEGQASEPSASDPAPDTKPENGEPPDDSVKTIPVPASTEMETAANGGQFACTGLESTGAKP